MVKDEILVESQHEASLSYYEIERNKPMPNRIHGFIQSKIGFLLMTFYGDKYQLINELSLDTLPPSTPNICIYPMKDLSLRNTQAKESEPPLTAIEILSPSQSLNELMHKAWDLYFPMGVKSVWIVVPEFRAIHVMMPNDEALYFGSGKLTDPATGVEIEVEKVFERVV